MQCSKCCVSAAKIINEPLHPKLVKRKDLSYICPTNVNLFIPKLSVYPIMLAKAVAELVLKKCLLYIVLFIGRN